AFFGTVMLPLIWVAVPVQTPLTWVDVPPPTVPVQVMFPFAARAPEEPPNTIAATIVAARLNTRMTFRFCMAYLPCPGSIGYRRQAGRRRASSLRLFYELRSKLN